MERNEKLINHEENKELKIENTVDENSFIKLNSVENEIGLFTDLENSTFCKLKIKFIFFFII